MSKQYEIRWRRSDYSRLSHKIRKYNEKIFKIEVTRPDIAEYQPEMVDYQDIKSMIKTRSDLNMWLKKMDRYLREGVEELDQTGEKTKYLRKEISIGLRVQHRKANKKAEEIGNKEVTIAGKGTGNKRKEMGSIKENEVKPLDVNLDKLTMEGAKKLERMLFKRMFSSYDEEKARLYMRNYIIALKGCGYPDDVIQMLNKVPLRKFVELADTDEIATIDFIYDLRDMEFQTEKLRSFWENYTNDKHNNKIDFKEIDDYLDQMDEEQKYYRYQYRKKIIEGGFA